MTGIVLLVVFSGCLATLLVFGIIAYFMEVREGKYPFFTEILKSYLDNRSKIKILKLESKINEQKLQLLKAENDNLKGAV